MATPLIKTSLAAGEVAPSLYGHVDLARYQAAASTMRNMFVSYRGGAYSRAGTAFVGYSKQTGRAYPPRVIPFQFSILQGLALEFGNFYMRVIFDGGYVLEPAVVITGVSQADPGIVSLAGGVIFNAGDWIYLSGIDGPTALNNQTFVAQATAPGQFALYDVFGDPVDTSAMPAYVSGGTAARIYTLTTTYAEADLSYLKFTQSADVMTLCLVNQETAVEYAPQDLTRVADDNWTLTPVVPVPTIGPPTGATATASSGGSNTSGWVDYQYVVTAIADDGTESVASNIASVDDAVDIASTAGSITTTWHPSAGAAGYYIYKATPTYSATSGGPPPPTGAQFGFAGQAYGTQFIDSNIVADFAQVPPTHQNPFAPGQILGAQPTAGGSGYTHAAATLYTTTGAGAALTAVIVGGAVVAWIVNDPGQDYSPGDSMSVSGDGTGATADLLIGPQSGNYPGVPSYFQERAVFGYSLNDPDTYHMSQPGAFSNFDIRDPPLESDAVTGSPWGVEVNGIQFFTLTAAGLLVFTGLSAWLLVGQGSFATNVQAIGPATQVANPQAFTGCSPTVPPIKINYDVIYLTSKGSYYYDLPYQLYALSEPIDITQYSAHLFTGYTILQHAWCEQPNKILWAVRSDGALLSLTWLKIEQVAGWARHDTNGAFVSVCSVTEPPVDALYCATQRIIGGRSSYIVERMDNRIWAQAEDVWAVDCAFTLPQDEPAATLTMSSPTGLGSIPGVTGLVGGANYGAGTIASVVDDNGQGPGAGAIPTIVIGPGGVITSVTFAPGNQGAGYVRPKLVFFDPSNQGAGASAVCLLDNSAIFSASANVFQPNHVGWVIRAGGGIASITRFVSARAVEVNILQPVVATYADGAPGAAIVAAPQVAGNWTLAQPVGSISGLDVLAGAVVTGLADGNVIPPTQVSGDGVLTLPQPASAVTIGLGFQAQVQGVYLDAGEPTVQGQRKKIAAATARLEASRGVKIGANQPDGSTLSPAQLAPVWSKLDVLPDQGAQGQPQRAYNALCDPLYTCDVRTPISGGFQKKGQVCLQQDNPLPMQVLAFIPELLGGDTPEQVAKPKPQAQPQRRAA